MLTLKVMIFIISTAIILFLSRRSLIIVRSHGFFRFFAFEFIIILFLKNVDFWFISTFAFNQIISWILLVNSTFFVVEGYRLLRSKGNPDELRPDENLFKLEKTTKLVTEGIYRYIRHPLYSSLLFLAWGIFFKHFSITGLFLVIGATTALILAGKFEEKENISYFGEEYESYVEHTKKFIPYVW